MFFFCWSFSGLGAVIAKLINNMTLYSVSMMLQDEQNDVLLLGMIGFTSRSLCTCSQCRLCITLRVCEIYPIFIIQNNTRIVREPYGSFTPFVCRSLVIYTWNVRYYPPYTQFIRDLCARHTFNIRRYTWKGLGRQTFAYEPRKHHEQRRTMDVRLALRYVRTAHKLRISHPSKNFEQFKTEIT